jgi:fucose 4-O-acetylase-like acetyltransferase
MNSQFKLAQPKLLPPPQVKTEPPSSNFEEQLSETLYWIRGVAIALVVLGHVIGFDRDYGMRQQYNSDLSWLGILGDSINTIHMPAFFIASGLATSFFSRRLESYGAFISTKLPRLLLPLVCWAPPFFIFQSLAKGQPVNLESVLSSIYEPYQIFWFLHALIFAVTFRFLTRKLQCSQWVYFGLSVILMVLSLSPSFGAFLIYGYWNFFFAVGIVMSSLLPIVDPWLQARSRWKKAGIMLVCITIIMVAKSSLPSPSQFFVLRLITGIPGFILLYTACGFSKRVSDRMALPILHRSVIDLGVMSMVVYLFHGYFTRFSSLMMTKLLGPIPPIGYFLILSTMGIAAPLILNVWILKKNAFLSYVTGGK